MIVEEETAYENDYTRESMDFLPQCLQRLNIDSQKVDTLCSHCSYDRSSVDQQYVVRN